MFGRATITFGIGPHSSIIVETGLGTKIHRDDIDPWKTTKAVFRSYMRQTVTTKVHEKVTEIPNK